VACNSSSEACSKVIKELSGIGQGVQDLVELALRRTLMPRLGVLDDKDHGKGQGGHQCLEDGFPPCRKPGGKAHDNP
jgi:hypothetical protein